MCPWHTSASRPIHPKLFALVTSFPRTRRIADQSNGFWRGVDAISKKTANMCGPLKISRCAGAGLFKDPATFERARFMKSDLAGLHRTRLSDYASESRGFQRGRYWTRFAAR